VDYDSHLVAGAHTNPNTSSAQVETHALIHQVSYSLHSCFQELEAYVQLVQPKYVAGELREHVRPLGFRATVRVGLRLGLGLG